MKEKNQYLECKKFLGELLHSNLEPRKKTDVKLVCKSFINEIGGLLPIFIATYSLYFIIYFAYLLFTLDDNASRVFYFVYNSPPDTSFWWRTDEIKGNYITLIQDIFLYPFISYILLSVISSLCFLYKTGKVSFFKKDAIADNILSLGILLADNQTQVFMFEILKKENYSCSNKEPEEFLDRKQLKILNEQYDRFSDSYIRELQREDTSLNISTEDLSYLCKILSILYLYRYITNEHKKNEIIEKNNKIIEQKKIEKKQLISDMESKKNF